MNSIAPLILIALCTIPSALAIRCGSSECDEQTHCCVGALLSRQCKPLAQLDEVCSMTQLLGVGLLRNCPCDKGLDCVMNSLQMKCEAQTTTAIPPTPETTTLSTTETTTPSTPETTTLEATTPSTPEPTTPAE